MFREVPIQHGRVWRFVTHVFYLFGLLGSLFIPFRFHLLPFQLAVNRFVCAPIMATFFPSKSNIDISSDSLWLLLLLGFLLMVSVVIVSFSWIIRVNSNRFKPLINSVLVYYIAVILLKYGFDKITKSQFYLPEPNTLFTPLGQLPKDALYWSVMGLSYPFSLVVGITEAVVSLLIIVRRTRVFGLLLSAGILAHIVLLNLSFHISVKVFSLFLLGVNILILQPFLRDVFGFFFLQKTTSIALLPQSPLDNLPIWRRVGVKVFIVCCLFIEALYPQINGKSFDDDTETRPPLHGAYAVQDATDNLKLFFFHRNNYLILQQNDDTFIDYKCLVDTNFRQIKLLDYAQKSYTLQYKVLADTLWITGQIGRQNINIRGVSIPWKTLPALKN